MQRIVKITILLSAWVLVPGAFAQHHFALKDAAINVKPVEYHIADVKDGLTLKNGIGSIITAANEKATISIENGVKNGLKTFITKNLSGNTLTVPVLYHVRQLNVVESKNAEGGVRGRMSLVVSFERIGKSDTVALVSSDVYMDYKRSGGAPSMNNYESVLRQLVVQTLQYFDDWMEINNGRHEALAKGIQIVFLPEYKTNDNDTIYYETRKVNWDDFRGKPSALSRYGAAIFSNFAYSSSFHVAAGLIHASIQTKTYMVRGMSWANESAKNEYSLAHEQLHFDITKLVTERFRKKVQAMQAQSIDDLNSMIQYEYLESYREMNRLQKEYDAETRHSLDTVKQAEWAQKIKLWLSQTIG